MVQEDDVAGPKADIVGHSRWRDMGAREIKNVPGRHLQHYLPH